MFSTAGLYIRAWETFRQSRHDISVDRRKLGVSCGSGEAW